MIISIFKLLNSYTIPFTSIKLNYTLCQKKYVEYLDIVENTTTVPSLIEIVNDIKKMGIEKLITNETEISIRLQNINQNL